MDDDTKTTRGPAAHLRLVASRPPAVVALPAGSYDVRFVSTRRPDPSTKEPVSGHERRTVMRIIKRIIDTAARFTVGFGTGLALVCAFVIVTTDPRLESPPTAPLAEVVRLDPVVVTIAAARYAELQAAFREPSAVVRYTAHGAEEG